MSSSVAQNFRDLYKYRSLVWALTLRHLAMRYRGSVLGFLWSFLNPLCLMLVYTLVFKYYIRFSQVDNYVIFLFCGLLPWICISSGLSEGVSSIVASGHLITKSMFPAHILPAVAVLTSTFNFVLSLPLLFIFMYFAGLSVHLSLLFVPVLLLIQMVFMFGLTLGLSALNVHFRDTQHIVLNLLTFLFFLCPIVYPSSVVPQRFHFTMELNPVALITQFYQKTILDGVMPETHSIAFLFAVSGLVLLFGNYVYNYYRESFAELL